MDVCRLLASHSHSNGDSIVVIAVRIHCTPINWPARHLDYRRTPNGGRIHSIRMRSWWASSPLPARSSSSHRTHPCRSLDTLWPTWTSWWPYRCYWFATIAVPLCHFPGLAMLAADPTLNSPNRRCRRTHCRSARGRARDHWTGRPTSARICYCCWCRVWGHSVDGQHPSHWTADQYCLSSMTTVNYCYCQTPDWSAGDDRKTRSQYTRVVCVCVWRRVFVCVGEWVLMRLVAFMRRVFVWQCLEFSRRVIIAWIDCLYYIMCVIDAVFVCAF